MPQDEKNIPEWLQGRILEHSTQPVANPPIQIDACLWNGDTVYHETVPCCDQFTLLFSQAGELICHPSGGITGRGDGKCPDFNSTHKVLYTVWKDDRNTSK